MIRSGICTDQVDSYLMARQWFRDAAQQLDRRADELVAELVDGMLASGAVTVRNKRLHATANHTPVAAEELDVPFPSHW